jgi:hypothetical protein
MFRPRGHDIIPREIKLASMDDNVEIYARLALALGIGLVVGVATLLIARGLDGASRARHALDLGKAGDLTIAVSFAAFLGLVTLAAHYAEAWFGGLGVLAVSAVFGLALGVAAF